MLTGRSDQKADHLQAEQLDGLIAAAGIDGTRDIMDAFWRSTTDLLKALSSHTKDGSSVLAAQTAHAIKGSAANVGAARLAQTASTIEELCKNDPDGALCGVIETICDEFTTLREIIEDHLNKSNG